MTDQVNIASAPKTGQDFLAGSLADLAVDLQKAEVALRETIEHVGRAVGLGVTPNLHAGVTDIMRSAANIASLVTYWQTRHTQDYDRLLEAQRVADRALVDLSETGRLLEQARGIACSLEAENAALLAISQASERITALPIIVDYTLAPGVVELRGPLGVVLARLTGIAVDADDLADATEIALGGDPADLDAEELDVDVADILGVDPMLIAVAGYNLPRPGEPAQHGYVGNSIDPCVAEVVTGQSGRRIPCGYPPLAPVHVVAVVDPDSVPLPDSATWHSYMPADKVDHYDRCGRAIAPVTPDAPPMFCGAPKRTPVHMQRHLFAALPGRRGCSVVIDGARCGYVDHATCHLPPAERTATVDGDVLATDVED